MPRQILLNWSLPVTEIREMKLKLIVMNTWSLQAKKLIAKWKQQKFAFFKLCKKINMLAGIT